MNYWKPIAGLLFGISLVFLAACQEEEPPPKPEAAEPLGGVSERVSVGLGEAQSGMYRQTACPGGV